MENWSGGTRASSWQFASSTCRLAIGSGHQRRAGSSYGEGLSARTLTVNRNRQSAVQRRSIPASLGKTLIDTVWFLMIQRVQTYHAGPIIWAAYSTRRVRRLSHASDIAL